MDEPNFKKPFVVPQGETDECRKWRESNAGATRTLQLADIGARFVLAHAKCKNAPFPGAEEVFEMLGLTRNDPEAVDKAMEATKEWAEEVVGREMKETQDGWEDQVRVERMN